MKSIEKQMRPRVLIPVVLALLALPAGASAVPGCGRTSEEIATVKNGSCTERRLDREEVQIQVDQRAYQHLLDTGQSGTIPLREASERVEDDSYWIGLLETAFTRIRHEACLAKHRCH